MATSVRLWLSHSSDYENFEEGVKDSNSFALEIPTTNKFRWVEGVESLLVGTSGEEWRVFSSTLDVKITPTNFKFVIQSGFGSNTVQPIIANSVVLFCDTIGRRVHELAWDDMRQKFLAPDLSVLAEHITETGIVCWALQKNPDMIVWCVLDDGSLISMTYNREQNIIAWADHPMDGATIKSVCVTPNTTTDEDEITYTVERDVNSVTVTYIEKLNSRARASTLADCYFVDSGITYSGAAANIITGCLHLRGLTVSVLGSGGTSGTGTVYTDIVVSATGTVTLPASNTVTKAQVGLPSTYELQPMRLDVSSQQGTSLGSIKKIPELVVSLLDSANVEYGDSSSNLYDIDTTSTGLINKSAVTGLFSGDVPLHLDGGFSVDDSILITGSDPLPCCVRCIVPKVDKTGR